MNQEVRHVKVPSDACNAYNVSTSFAARGSKDVTAYDSYYVNAAKGLVYTARSYEVSTAMIRNVLSNCGNLVMTLARWYYWLLTSKTEG
ncbi:hypothetical protein Tco_1267247 [Tanacetum coccineum]